jgi:hypothetical protein
VATLGVSAGEGTLATLVRNGWIERRGERQVCEVRLTEAKFDPRLEILTCERGAELPTSSRVALT